MYFQYDVWPLILALHLLLLSSENCKSSVPIFTSKCFLLWTLCKHQDKACGGSCFETGTKFLTSTFLRYKVPTLHSCYGTMFLSYKVPNYKVPSPIKRHKVPNYMLIYRKSEKYSEKSSSWLARICSTTAGS